MAGVRTGTSLQRRHAAVADIAGTAAQVEAEALVPHERTPPTNRRRATGCRASLDALQWRPLFQAVEAGVERFAVRPLASAAISARASMRSPTPPACQRGPHVSRRSPAGGYCPTHPRAGRNRWHRAFIEAVAADMHIARRDTASGRWRRPRSAGRFRRTRRCNRPTAASPPNPASGQRQVALHLPLERAGRQLRRLMPAAAPDRRVQLQLAFGGRGCGRRTRPANSDWSSGSSRCRPPRVAADPPVVADHLAGGIDADAVVTGLRQDAAAGQVAIPAAGGLRHATAVDAGVQRATPASVRRTSSPPTPHAVRPTGCAAEHRPWRCSTVLQGAGRVDEGASRSQPGAMPPSRRSRPRRFDPLRTAG